ncbi:MAG: hypothetical protein AABY53_05790, partial [Bdellovibrionota bacterium]
MLKLVRYLFSIFKISGHSLLLAGLIFASETTKAQSCTDLGFTGLHTEIISQSTPGIEGSVQYEVQTIDIVRLKIPTNHPIFPDNYLIPLETTIEQIFGNGAGNYNPVGKTISSGSLSQQFGSTDFKITPIGPGGVIGEIPPDVSFFFKIAFTPTIPGVSSGTAVIIYTGIAQQMFFPFSDFGFSQRICYEYTSIAIGVASPDLTLGPISVLDAIPAPGRVIPSIQVDTPTQINVPVSISFDPINPLTPAQLG